MTDFDYDDIRPYSDAELPGILQKLLADVDFLQALKALKAPWLPDSLAFVWRPMLRFKLARYFASIRSIADLQNLVERALEQSLEASTDGFRVQGGENLQADREYVFISNHRDIVLDPALCNLALHRLGRKTCRIAIGDNLLTKPFAEHLMRVNKSFIVKRSVSSGRAWFLEMKKLSTYIRKSVHADGEPVWIAQREGRAKDGIDQSDPALIKMLALSKQKPQSFAEAIRELNIVPVAISYEWDPCDVAKACELASKAENGVYEKAEHEDIASIARGIQGEKGLVSFHFGEMLDADFENPEQVAEAIDAQIHRMYAIHPSNLAACQELGESIPEDIAAEVDPTKIAAAQATLIGRTEALSSAEKSFLLHAYANPVRENQKRNIVKDDGLQPSVSAKAV